MLGDSRSPRTSVFFRRSKRRSLIGLVAVSGLASAGILAFAAPASAIETAVPLGTTAPFSVLAGQSVTNTGPSVLGGGVGVSPGTAISGFPPGVVGGTVHAADAVALQAQADLTAAYNDAAGQAPDANVAADLGGLTLTPGVYNAAGSIGLTGALTLNGQGDPNSVFIFQIGSALTTATASSVALINGVQACNVFWQIGSSATLGTNSSFLGSILALTSITANTGATVVGRALARNGSVTLDTNTFTTPTCAAPPTTPPPSSTAPATTAPATSAAATSAASAPSGGVPSASGATPVSGTTAGGAVVTVTGSGFVPGQTTVTIGGTTIPASAVTVVNATTLRFTTPAHAAGAVPLVVTTAGGTSQALTYTYLAGIGSTGTELAATGTPAGPLLGLAALLLIVGAVTLQLARRPIASAHRRH